jgi:hypothetical protein
LNKIILKMTIRVVLSGNKLGHHHLQVPEEESEDESDAKTHEPGDEHERSASNVGKVTQDGHPFGDLAGRLGKHFALADINHLIRLAAGGEIDSDDNAISST